MVLVCQTHGERLVIDGRVRRYEHPRHAQFPMGHVSTPTCRLLTAERPAAGTYPLADRRPDGRPAGQQCVIVELGPGGSQ